MKQKLIAFAVLLFLSAPKVNAQEKSNVKFGDVTEKDFAKKYTQLTVMPTPLLLQTLAPAKSKETVKAGSH